MTKGSVLKGDKTKNKTKEIKFNIIFKNLVHTAAYQLNLAKFIFSNLLKFSS